MVKLEQTKSIVEQIHDDLEQRLGQSKDFDEASITKLQALIDSGSLNSLEKVERAIKPNKEGE